MTLRSPDIERCALALLAVLAAIPAAAGPRAATPRPATCAHPFENPTWRLELCLAEPFRFFKGNGGLTGHLLLGPRTAWPFLGGFRYLLKVVPRESLASLRARMAKAEAAGSPQYSQIRVLTEGTRSGLLFRETAITQQCPGVKLVIPGAAHNLEIGYPDCGGLVDARFHREAEQFFRALLRTAVFR